MGVETCDQHQYLDVYKHIHLTQLKNSKCRNMLQMNTLIIWKNIYSKSTSKTHQPVRLSISNIIPTLERLATIQNYKYWLTATATTHFCVVHNYVCDTEPIKAHKQEVWRCAGYRKHQCERCVLQRAISLWHNALLCSGQGLKQCATFNNQQSSGPALHSLLLWKQHYSVFVIKP